MRERRRPPLRPPAKAGPKPHLEVDYEAAPLRSRDAQAHVPPSLFGGEDCVSVLWRALEDWRHALSADALKARGRYLDPVVAERVDDCGLCGNGEPLL